MASATRSFARSGPSAGLVVYAAVMYAFLYAPIAVVIILSVNDSTMVGFPFRGFTLKWFWTVFTSADLLQATANSLILGVASATIATVLALSLALAFRRDFALKSTLLNLILIPIILPGIVSGAVLVVLFGMAGIELSLWTSALVAHITFVLPFAFLNLYPRLHNFDSSIEEAARDLGATPRLVLIKVVLPIIRPGIVAAALFAFSLSFDEFVRTLLLVGFD
jgi:spermidine/putrescine transport system permease protein